MQLVLDPKNFPKFQLSTSQDIILFLIKNELLHIKFVNQLHTIGFDTSAFTIELGTMILSLMGFKNRNDSLWDWYHTTLDSYAAKIDIENQNSINEVVFDFYVILQVKLETEKKNV